MQTNFPPRFGALLPIKTTVKRSASGKSIELAEMGRVLIGHKIEQKIMHNQPGADELRQQLQAIDPSFQANEPVMLINDFRSGDKPEAYFVTGKKDVEIAKATYQKELEKELNLYCKEVLPNGPLPYFRNTQVGLSSDRAQGETIDELKKTLTNTVPVQLEEIFTAVPGQVFHNQSHRIVPSQS